NKWWVLDGWSVIIGFVALQRFINIRILKQQKLCLTSLQGDMINAPFTEIIKSIFEGDKYGV
ncbi:MAG: hypothetical protein RSB57_09505, partial [Hungatella sp.]